MDEIKRKYELSVKNTKLNLNRILEELDIKDPKISKTLSNLIDASSTKLTEKWVSGRKYVRTYFVKKAMANYPEEAFDVSIQLDAIVNILDDLLDEKVDEKEKTLYIVEFLRIFAINNAQEQNPSISKKIAKYFEELICIAVLEDIYYKKIENSSDPDNIIKDLIKVYNCRSNDIDIFVQIPLFEIYGDENEEGEKILKAARLFRAINLIMKDMKDIEHDIEHDSTSAILILSRNSK
ncbi:MAG: hypothetical protein U9O53_01120, partial [archaeon]|nr:hypothetical protein [archaeon]